MSAVLPKVHQPALAPFVKDEFLTREGLEKIRGMLERNRALNWASGQAKGSSLCPSLGVSQAANTGSVDFNKHVWVRDNMFMAMALHATDIDGDSSAQAAAIVGDVATFFLKTAARLDDIIAGHADPRDAMLRPHVRFNGETLEEDDEFWNHKQNDALGYFIWLRCRLCVDGKMPMTGNHLRLLGLMVEYLMKIEYWRDEDAGPWEEEERIGASSIGPVLAAAQELRKLLNKYPGMMVPCQDGTLEAIEQKGAETLKEILPNECIQDGRQRETDAALLFLVYPLRVVDKDMGRAIVKAVEEQLVGSVGVRRFNGDSYWCKDFKRKFGRTTKVFTAEAINDRNAYVSAGEEAQWCLFDSLLSCIYGLWYQEERDVADLLQQQQYLLRSLAQVTGPDCPAGPWLCPECYSLSKDTWIASDVSPHLWTQANLHLALFSMDKSLEMSHGEVKSEFKKFDTGNIGKIAVEDLVAVLTKLNPELPAKDVSELLEDFAHEGVVSFDKLIDGLFSGEMTAPARAAFNLRGLRPLGEMSPDEIREVERVITEALLGLHGEFQGEYFPLPSSDSFPACMGGMSDQDQKTLCKSGLMFDSAESSGRGIFANGTFDVAVLVNSSSHVELVVRPPLGDNLTGAARLWSLEKVVRDSLRLSGHDIVKIDLRPSETRPEEAN
mmetsp:Transcript_107728/g.310173  ORF Transcript_107728/g.310173 Transcript_107728/m.310173 type:complete len:667 (+) Transcript_107728:96-2096(+)